MHQTRQQNRRRVALIITGRSARETGATTGRNADTYIVSPDQREAFQRDGFVHLPGVMSDDELVDNVDGLQAARKEEQRSDSHKE